MSDDELGGYNATTPKPTAPAQRAQPRPRQVSRPQTAGPSSKAAPAAGSSKATTSKVPIEADITILSSDEETQPPPPAAAAATKTKGKPAAAPVAAPASKPAAKGKGKGKPDSTGDVEMETNEAQSSEPANPPPRPAARTARPNPKQSGGTNARPQRSAADASLEQENARLHKRLDDISSQRDKLAAQLQEALQIRQTEPEQLLQEHTAQLEATVRAQDLLIQEQTAKLAALGALSNSNHSVQFISREAAEEERKDLVLRLRKLEQVIREKDTKISELNSKHSELEKQLAAEIEMAKEYRAKNPPGGKVNGGSRIIPTSAATNPLKGEVIKLYEDLTNFLVTNVVHNPPPFPQWPDLHDYTFNCSYTYIDSSDEGGPNPSLQFNLRSTWMRKDATSVKDNETMHITSKDQLEAKVQYWPVNLEMETEEFRTRMDFFGDAFVFSREQMHVFLRTLGERLAATQEEDGEMEQVEDEVTVLS